MNPPVQLTYVYTIDKENIKTIHKKTALQLFLYQLETSIAQSNGCKTNEMPGSGMGGEGGRIIPAGVVCPATTQERLLIISSFYCQSILFFRTSFKNKYYTVHIVMTIIIIIIIISKDTLMKDARSYSLPT